MTDAGEPSLGALIRSLRLSLGYSQGRLAARLCELGSETVTRECVSRWERDRRTPVYWLPHLATALKVPLQTLEAARVKRRDFLRLTALSPGLGATDMALELTASIAGGDSTPLAEIQTTHRTDLAVSQLVGTDRASLLHLARWMADGETGVLRVNTAGILAKTTDTDMLDSVALTLNRDAQARKRYLWALTSRVGDSVPVLSKEVLNPRDSGARWCAARLLGQDGGIAAREALAVALRRESVLENVRTIGLILNGVDPCM